MIFSLQHEVLEQDERALGRDVQLLRDDAVGDRHRRLVRVAALAHQHPLGLELLGHLVVLEGDARVLHVVVEQAVVDRVVAQQVRGHGPVDAGHREDDREGLEVLRPGEELAGVVHDQVVGALDVERDLDVQPGLLLDVLLGELDDVLHAGRVHARSRSRSRAA